MKAILIALSVSLVLATACTPLPNSKPAPSAMPDTMPSATTVSMTAHDPDKAEVVSVDRFQDNFATLFKRSGPAFDSDNVSKIVPAPNAPIDMDTYFLVHSLGPKGESVTYYALDVVSNVPGEAWVFVDSKGMTVPGQLSIIKALPGAEGYNDFVRITEVMVKDDYTPNSLVSVADVKAAMSAGDVTLKETQRIANWAVVPQGTIAKQTYQGRPVDGYRAWYQGQVAHYLSFDEDLKLTADGKVPDSPIVVIFNNGMDPSKGFKAETSGQTHNVIATLPGDAAYSSLWKHTIQGDPTGFDKVHDFASATDNKGGELPGILVNCPVVGAVTGSADMERNFMVTIENPSDGGSPLSPGVFVIHREGMPLFHAGQMDMGKGIEAQAEDGNPMMLAASSGGMIFNTPVENEEPGPATPGKRFQLNFKAKPGDYLSFTTMFGQSNDLFYAPMDKGIALFSGTTPMMGDITDQVMLWDAGTEVNQMPGEGPDQAPRQAGPNTGASEAVAIQTVADRKDGFTYKNSIKVTIAAQ